MNTKLPYGMKFLQVLLFAIISTIRQKKFLQKIISRKNLLR